MNVSRRGFLGGLGAAGLLGGCRTPWWFGEAPRLKFGVISDIHVTIPESTARFRRALAYFRDEGVDAVMVAGDLSDWGLESGFRYVADTWYDIFPDDCGATVHPSNAFVGNYLRLELLSRAGLSSRILDETKDYLYGMARRTGTLWEHDNISNSCDHGFASHAAVVLLRDVLGVRTVDYSGKRLFIDVAPSLPLSFCRGGIPVSADRVLHVEWKRSARGLEIRYDIPSGWSVDVSERNRCFVENGRNGRRNGGK